MNVLYDTFTFSQTFNALVKRERVPSLVTLTTLKMLIKTPNVSKRVERVLEEVDSKDKLKTDSDGTLSN